MVHELEAENLQRRQKRSRPELLRGTTRRLETPLGTLFVTVTEDDRGQPVCGTRSNLFWVRGGELRTPALERCGVAGLMRRKVLELAGRLGLKATVRDGDWAEFGAADEVFLTNSLIGIWPVATCGSWRRAAPGPVTRRLTEQLRHPRLAQP